jgi:Right handed beta helix region
MAAGARLVASATASDRIKSMSAYVCGGADDQVQINHAITDTLAEGGGTVLLSLGEFTLSDSVLIPVGSGLEVVGSGWGTVLKNGTASNRYAVKFADVGETRAVFRDFTIDGNMAGQTSSGGGVWAQGAVQSRFENMKFTACYDESIHFGPVNPTTSGHSNYVTGCLFENAMTSPGQGRGIHMTGSTGNYVLGCEFRSMGGANTTAAGIYDQAGFQLIQGCDFSGGRANVAAVRMQDSTYTRVLGCGFDIIGGDGVFVTGEGHLVSDSTFTGVGIAGAPGLVTGVKLDFGAKNCQVTGNTLVTHTVDGAAHSLIRELADGGAGGNSFTGNVLIQKGLPAIALLDLSGANSTVRDNTGAGAAGHEEGPVRVNAGAVTDASFPATRPPVSGTMALDTTNNRLYVRVGSVWKYSALT